MRDKPLQAGKPHMTRNSDCTITQQSPLFVVTVGNKLDETVKIKNTNSLLSCRVVF